MEPKLKAEELLSVFAKIIPASSYEAYEGGVKINFDLENAKQCALIAVDEIINNSLEYMGCDLKDGEIIYWQEVKQEIKKL